MRSSKEDALALLGKWKDEDRWTIVLAFFAPKERYEFWAKVAAVSLDEVAFSGERAALRARLDDFLTFEYSDAREIPAPMRDVLKDIEFSLVMASQSSRIVVSVMQAGHGPPR